MRGILHFGRIGFDSRYPKVNTRFFIAMLAVLSVIVLAGKVVHMILTGEAADHGEPTDGMSDKAFLILIALPLSTYVYSFINMLWQYVKHKGVAFVLTEDGIENTLTAFILFAFVFVIPVKRIPWDAVKSIKNEDGVFTARLDVKKVQAGPLAKGALKIMGYRFFSKYTKRNITPEEIALYYEINPEA